MCASSSGFLPVSQACHSSGSLDAFAVDRGQVDQLHRPSCLTKSMRRHCRLSQRMKQLPTPWDSASTLRGFFYSIGSLSTLCFIANCVRANQHRLPWHSASAQQQPKWQQATAPSAGGDYLNRIEDPTWWIGASTTASRSCPKSPTRSIGQCWGEIRLTVQKKPFRFIAKSRLTFLKSPRRPWTGLSTATHEL